MITEILAGLKRFPDLTAAVIGDLMLDHYITGATERTSPEAPVPVVLVSDESHLAGGAANVARNATAAGARVLCVGAIGADTAGEKLRDLLDSASVDVTGLIELKDFHTIIKTRIVSQGQQIVRLDYEMQCPNNDLAVAALCEGAETAISQADVVILSDYGKGVLGPQLLERVISAAHRKNIPVIVDPKGRDYSRYRGAFAITPNSREAREVTGIAIDSPDGLLKASEALRDVTGCEQVVITRGAEGLSLYAEGQQLITVPTSAREVFDVTGAGDTFVAWFSLAHAAGLDAELSARLANTAAGVSVGRVGPAVVSPLDIHHTLVPSRLGKKLINEKDLAALGQQLRASGQRVVLTNGCFDFLHAGHIAFLQQARALGDVLVLAMNTDDSIRRLKGEPRPIIPQMQRAELLASIDAVDFVTVFESDTPQDVIRALRPDILVKGGNYSLDQVEGAELIAAAGGDVVTIPLQHDIRTSRLIGQ